MYGGIDAYGEPPPPAFEAEAMYGAPEEAGEEEEAEEAPEEPPAGPWSNYPQTAEDVEEMAYDESLYTRDVLTRAKAVCIGCNYPHADKKSQLQGACTDARNWRNLLTHTYGIAATDCALLVDVDPNGYPVSKDDDTYPSQEAILDHLDWLVDDARSPQQKLFFFLFSARRTNYLNKKLEKVGPFECDN
jgi:hypothetical protein